MLVKIGYAPKEKFGLILSYTSLQCLETTLSTTEKCSYSEFLWSAFSCMQTQYGDLRSKSLYSVGMRENADQENFKYGQFLFNVVFIKFTRYC